MKRQVARSGRRLIVLVGAVVLGASACNAILGLEERQPAECSEPSECGTDTTCLAWTCDSRQCGTVKADVNTVCDDGNGCGVNVPCV